MIRSGPVLSPASAATRRSGLCVVGAVPVADLYPFSGFEVLIVLEEMFDLLQRDFGQVGVGQDLVVTPGQLVRRHGDDLLVRMDRFPLKASRGA
jgi:hypothetical protein